MTVNDLHPIEASEIHARRERVFLVLAGLFLGSMTMLNILGISRFIHLYTLDWMTADGNSFPLTFTIAVGISLANSTDAVALTGW